MSEIPVISIVDDDESIGEAVGSLIKSIGFSTDVFASAEDFLNSGHLDNTACLILDLRMPGMSGLDLQRHLSRTCFRIPIVFITAHGYEDSRRLALAAGAVAFLRKPFSEEALLNAVNAAIELHRVGDRAG